MTKQFITPILLIIFNRPDKTNEVFEVIKKIHPAKLFIAADGPRKEKTGEKERCEKARKIATQVDWPCEIYTDFLDNNMGCDRRVATAIDWFFSKVNEGIILEDDCLPSTDFFPFCRELLETYKGVQKIMTISGNNFQNGIRRGKASYYFSRYSNTWGWATWKRAWVSYQDDLGDFKIFKENKNIEKILPSKEEQIYWLSFFEKIKGGKYTFWDAKWIFSMWNQNGINIVPNTNLVKNIGQDNQATHTKRASPKTTIEPEKMDFPLKHPEKIQIDNEADRYIFKVLYHTPLHIKLLNRLRLGFQ